MKTHNRRGMETGTHKPTGPGCKEILAADLGAAIPVARRKMNVSQCTLPIRMVGTTAYFVVAMACKAMSYGGMRGRISMILFAVVVGCSRSPSKNGVITSFGEYLAPNMKHILKVEKLHRHFFAAGSPLMLARESAFR